MADATPFIEIRNVSRLFPGAAGSADVLALDGVNLTVEEGEFVVLLGPSGCGKTSLLRMIAGLDQPTEGLVLVSGSEVHGPSAERGMVFQSYTSFPWLNVTGNIEFGLARKRIPSAERQSASRRLIDLVGLQGFENALPRQLSGGMKQRLALARTLAMDPKVLLMDEPFGAIDAQTRRALQDELIDIHELTKKTVVFVTHDIDEALVLGSRIVVMSTKPGRVVHDEVMRSRGPRTAIAASDTDELAADKRRLSRLLHQNRVRVAHSGWEGNAPVLFASLEGFVPDGMDLVFGKSDITRKEGLRAGHYGCIRLSLHSALELVPENIGRIVLSTAESSGVGTDAIVVSRDRIPTPADLAGARIAFSPRSLEHHLLAMVFAAHHLDVRRLRVPGRGIVHCGRPDYVAHLRAGRVEAVVLREPAIGELFSMPGAERFAILPTSLEQSLAQQVCFASDAVIHRDGDLLLSYLRFSLEANSLFTQSEDDALAALRSSVGQQTTAFSPARAGHYSVFQNIVFQTLERNVELFLEGAMVKTLQALADVGYDAGILDTALDERLLQGAVETDCVRILASEAGLISP